MLLSVSTAQKTKETFLVMIGGADANACIKLIVSAEFAEAWEIWFVNISKSATKPRKYQKQKRTEEEQKTPTEP